MNTSNPNFRHGKCYTKLYARCAAIRQRCLNPNHKAYKNYGGRGITLHSAWLNDYGKMMEYLTDLGYTDKLTIDRIDNDGNYEPGNLRMATMKEQASNRRHRNLSQGDVREIKILIKSGQLALKAIGGLYGVGESCVGEIKSGRNWKHEELL